MIIVIAVAYRRLGNFVEGAVGNSGSYFVIAVTRWRLGAGAGAVERSETVWLFDSARDSVDTFSRRRGSRPYIRALRNADPEKRY